ncbi:isocitrate lyase/phosphoenolpyruvate mutase family protein [Niabella hibiscisoli]|uniref:isocitrate lyase/phosphoenolpyruvate mutase family protein n=1 Tax=Niabella hibiscisoli TaxID=1825928 RepID=UPI001F0F0F88|nr:isocitrate lyase/phosphoenolpyruvate mutase family protein [Niabella hibiscisoli]MCH5717929.1 isocitrate lyase/phosphoenolpyruvate mutase family protein [Niabella hibiscisoli]
MNTAEIFSSLHRQAKPLILPNARDAANAKIIEDAGATAIATTSAGVAWALGYPDGYRMSATLNAQVARSIARVIKVPLSVDFENGYSGNPPVVAENVKILLDAGIGGINIEERHDISTHTRKRIGPDLVEFCITGIKSRHLYLFLLQSAAEKESRLIAACRRFVIGFQ